MSVEPFPRSFEGATPVRLPVRWHGEKPLAAMVPAHGSLVQRWYRRWRHRREIQKLCATQPDSVLRDVGLTRIDALREANKPFWMA